MKKCILLCLIFSTLTACVPIVPIVPIVPSVDQMMADMYNVPYQGQSEFDGSKFMGITNCWCGTALSFDLYQNQELAKKNFFIVKAKVMGTENIGDGRSLHFNIDGDILSFGSSMLVTNFESLNFPDYVTTDYPISIKKYLVPESVLTKIINSDRFVAKVDLDITQTYVEGVCSIHKEWEGKYDDLACTEGFKKFRELKSTLSSNK